MKPLDRLRNELREVMTWRGPGDEMYWGVDVHRILDAFEANACDGCRHWGGEPGSAATAPCTVKGSFRAPGGLFTEGGFWCCHWTKS